ncbi:hypothetical protein MNBD_ACTINO02-977 [hydrothermal vent metagenome]|uniref:Uncharacterized protein n=1 Tax=hydrothermal vent metagenome TaxID=652676 RepID=A0A3B0T0D0_9ZZZZ
MVVVVEDVVDDVVELVVEDVVDDVLLEVVDELVLDVELVGGIVDPGGIDVVTTEPFDCAPAGAIDNTWIAGTTNAIFPAFFKNSRRPEPSPSTWPSS